MRRTSVAAALVAMLVLGLAAGLSACTRGSGTSGYAQPAQSVPIPGTTLHRVTLTEEAFRDVGVRTEPVRAAPPARTAPGHGSPAILRSTARTVIPTTAVIYDPLGGSWTYTIPASRTFVRKAIVIDHFDGEQAYLRSGPPVGTQVVTVGAAELMGVEYGVGVE